MFTPYFPAAAKSVNHPVAYFTSSYYVHNVLLPIMGLNVLMINASI